MKKLITLICAFVIGSMSFAQKNEIKEVEKALKKNNFSDAKTYIAKAESLIGNMDDKTKDKFYFLKAKSLYSNGTVANEDIDKTLDAINSLLDLKSKTGKSKYSSEALEIKNKLYSSVVNAAESAYKSRNFTVAADKYLQAYTLEPKDTLFLYASASSYLNDGKYDKSLELFEKLRELRYEGAGTKYTAVKKETGVTETFGDKKFRDIAVKSGDYIAPKSEKLPSKQGEILRYMALIYSTQNKSDKALELISKAKEYNPDDTQLVIAEAKAYLASNQKEKIKPLLEEANGLIAGDAVNLMNFGIFAMEIKENDLAKKYFKEASKIDPNMADPYLNLGALTLDGDQDLVDEMNGLGSSNADNKRYDELKEKRLNKYKTAIPFIEKAYELKPDLQTAKYLRDLYGAAFMTEKFKEMKQKVADLEAASGN